MQTINAKYVLVVVALSFESVGTGAAYTWDPT